MLKRRHCVEPCLKDKKKLCKTIGINADIVVRTTTQVGVKIYTGWAKSFSATVQEGCCTLLEVPVPYTKHCTWRTWPVSHAIGGHFPTFTANRSPVHSPLPSSLTWILLPTGAKRLFAERVFHFVKDYFTWVTMYPGFRRHSNVICAWFHASAAVQMRSSLFWDVTQRTVVITDVSGRLTSHTFKDQPVFGRLNHWRGNR